MPAMDDVLKHPEKTKIMVERGYRLVTEKFSVERMVRDTEKLYLSFTT